MKYVGSHRDEDKTLYVTTLASCVSEDAITIVDVANALRC